MLMDNKWTDNGWTDNSRIAGQHVRRRIASVTDFLMADAKQNTLDPRYNVLQYNADSVITWLRSWIPIFQGLTKAG